MYCIEETFKDFDGNERKAKFYFHFSEAEIMKLELKTEGGLETVLQRIIDGKDQAKTAEYFEYFLHKSYGVKSDDGISFDKSPEILNRFIAHAAYSQIYMRILTDAQAAADFINGIIPDMGDDAKKIVNDKIAELKANA